MLQLKKIEHKGEIRILLKSDYDFEMKEKFKKLPNAKYSSTYRAWHIKYDKLAFNEFKKLNIPFEIVQTDGTIDTPESNDDITGNTNTVIHENLENLSSDADISNEKVVENVRIEWNNRHFYIFLSYSKLESEFIKSLDGSYWNAKYKNWVVDANLINIDALQTRYLAWDQTQYNTMVDIIKQTLDPYKIQFFRTPEFIDKINIIIKGFRADIDFIKKIPDREYIKENKKWLIPLDKTLLKRIIEHYKADGAKIEDRTGIFEQKKKIQSSNSSQNFDYLVNKYPTELHNVLKKYTNTLIRQRYSQNTLKNYTHGFGRYLRYLQGKQIENTTFYDVNNYLAFISKANVSESYMNNEVNAIKFFYEKVEFISDFKIDRIKRPRKSHKLPVILSIKDVDKMLRSTENIKHLAILYTLYGGGLRLGEVLNLKIDDVYWDRDQIHVKNAKGKKDRYIMLSLELKNLLSVYFDRYRPKTWLFEGQSTDMPYSAKSVQSIVKQASDKAGITKKVTPHTLRHCFATHLMDGGVGIRYIQELLGHKDIHPVGLKKN